jgi:hypothetical protein
MCEATISFDMIPISKSAAHFVQRLAPLLPLLAQNTVLSDESLNNFTADVFSAKVSIYISVFSPQIISPHMYLSTTSNSQNIVSFLKVVRKK